MALASASHFLRINLPSFEAAWTSQIQPAACSAIPLECSCFLMRHQGIVSYASQLEVYEVTL